MPRRGDLSIADFRAGVKAKLPMLQVKVYKRVDEYTYKIRDASGKGQLSVMKNPALGKKLGLGIFVRLVDPIFDGQDFTLRRAPLLIPPILLHEDNESDEEDVGNDLPKGSASVKSFKDIESIPVRSCVPSVIAKVTSLSPKKKVNGPSGYIRTAGLTDHKGEKTAVNLFGDITDKIEKDRVYEFKNLEKKDFKKKTDKYNWLASRSNSDITEVEGELAAMFESLTEGDGVLIGTILGHEKIHYYNSCPSCKKGVPETAGTCPRCNVDLSNNSPIRDFLLTMHLVDDASDVKEVKCFRSTLDMSTKNLSDEEIKEKLDGLTDKECKIYFRKGESDDEMMTAIKIEMEQIEGCE